MDKFCSFIVCRLKKNKKLFLKHAFNNGTHYARVCLNYCLYVTKW